MPTPLQTLIADYIREKTDRGHPETYSSIARRGGLPRSTVYALATRPYTRQAPRPATIAKLAKGLEMTERQVRDIAGRGAGYGSTETAAHDNPTIQLLLATVQDLDPERLEAVQRRARLLHEEMLEERRRRRR